MHPFKVALWLVAGILFFPLIFLIYYSVQVGCLFCMEGDAAGSAAETWLNLGLGGVVVCAVAGALWRRFAKKPSNN